MTKIQELFCSLVFTEDLIASNASNFINLKIIFSFYNLRLELERGNFIKQFLSLFMQRVQLKRSLIDKIFIAQARTQNLIL